MSRKKTPINQERIMHIKYILKEEKLTQIKLGEIIGMTQQNISKIIRGHTALTEDTAKLIINAFPKYRLPWLLGYDHWPTHDDFDMYQNLAAHNDASYRLMDAAFRNVCLAEEIEPPALDNIPELLLMQAQIKDFAASLAWQYLHRENSSQWSYLDQIDETIKRKGLQQPNQKEPHKGQNKG